MVSHTRTSKKTTAASRNRTYDLLEIRVVSPPRYRGSYTIELVFARQFLQDILTTRLPLLVVGKRRSLDDCKGYLGVDLEWEGGLDVTS